MNTHYFCIAHKELLFEPPPQTKIIYTGKFKLNNDFNIINSKKNLYDRYRFLAGVAGSFFINELIKEYPDTDYVNICAYRKFVSPVAFSEIEPQVHLYKNSINNNKIKYAISNISSEYCFSTPWRVSSILCHYNEYHHIQDLLRFVSCAIDLEILPKNDLDHFLNSSIIIPGGIEIGKFPIKIYKEIISKLELVVNLFFQMHSISNIQDEYQRRGLAQCCERLSSWLLIKHLESKFEKPFIKNGSYISWDSKMLFNKGVLNFEEFFGYLHQIN